MKQYRKKSEHVVYALELDLELDVFQYKKWGGLQAAKQGDWLVRNGTETYTVDAQSFSRTYVSGDSPGKFVKTAAVWAEQALTNGEIKTREGISEYKQGDFLVYNRENCQDGYAVPKGEFLENYQQVKSMDEKKSSNVYEKEMEYLNAQKYLQSRVNQQIDWYENKSAKNQRAYKRMQVTSILFGSAIPILTVIDLAGVELYLRLIIALLGSGVAIISAVASLYKFEHYWIKYRSTAQCLIREKNLFVTRVEPYEDKTAFSNFVKTCESIMSAENGEWQQLFSGPKSKK